MDDQRMLAELEQMHKFKLEADLKREIGMARMLLKQDVMSLALARDNVDYYENRVNVQKNQLRQLKEKQAGCCGRV